MHLAQALIRLSVQVPDRGQGLVPRGLGLRAGGVEDLLGLRLGRPDAVFRRAVGLGDALAPALLGLLAQFPRGMLRRLDDPRDTGRGGAQVAGPGGSRGALSYARGIRVTRARRCRRLHVAHGKPPNAGRSPIRRLPESPIAFGPVFAVILEGSERPTVPRWSLRCAPRLLLFGMAGMSDMNGVRADASCGSPNLSPWRTVPRK